MAKQPKDPGDSFTYGEKAVAGPLSKSTYQFVLENEGNLLPSGPDISVVKRIAHIGGYMSAGVPLLLAAQLAKAISTEFPDGEAPSHLDETHLSFRREELAELPSPATEYDFHRLLHEIRAREVLEMAAATGLNPSIVSDAQVDRDNFNFWQWRLEVRKAGHRAELSVSYPDDVIVEILDRRHVFMRPTSRLKSATASEWEKQFPEKFAAQPGFVGWIENWERGAEPRFVHVLEKVNLGHDFSRASGARLQAVLEQDVIANSVGKITVNLSLAIRRAFERISERRFGASIEKGVGSEKGKRRKN